MNNKEKACVLVENAHNSLFEIFREIDEIAEYNQKKVLDAFCKNKIGEEHFYTVTGYGHDDIGRDALDKTYADVFNTEAALHEYNKYHIAAQKKFGNIVDDENRLCFISEEAEHALESELKGAKFKILFGHHPCEFFSKDARNQFDNFIDQNNIYIYLCGHTHRADGAIISPISNLKDMDSDGQKILQVTVGGSFLDHSDYNQLSFSIGEVSFKDGRISKSEVHLFTLIRDPLNNKPYWIESRKSILDNVGESISPDSVDPPKSKPESAIEDEIQKNTAQNESDKVTPIFDGKEEEEKSENSPKEDIDTLRKKSINYFYNQMHNNGR